MKYLVAKDKKKRLQYKKFEKQYLILKGITSNQFLDKYIRNSTNNYLSYKNVHFTQIKNRCIYSGRARSVNKDYKISRLYFKKLANFGYLPGIKKSSW